MSGRGWRIRNSFTPDSQPRKHLHDSLSEVRETWKRTRSKYFDCFWSSLFYLFAKLIFLNTAKFCGTIKTLEIYCKVQQWALRYFFLSSEEKNGNNIDLSFGFAHVAKQKIVFKWVEGKSIFFTISNSIRYVRSDKSRRGLSLSTFACFNCLMKKTPFSTGRSSWISLTCKI